MKLFRVGSENKKVFEGRDYYSANRPDQIESEHDEKIAFCFPGVFEENRKPYAGVGDKPRRHCAEGNRSANIRACDDRRGCTVRDKPYKRGDKRRKIF